MIKGKSKIHKLEQERTKLLDLLLSDDRLIEGSYSEILVKCGRAGCHCEKKPIHLVARLGIREEGKVKNKVVRVADRENVQKLTDRYKAHKQALHKLKQINEAERTILKDVMKQKNSGYS
jgi:hypothetical protein